MNEFSQAFNPPHSHPSLRMPLRFMTNATALRKLRLIWASILMATTVGCSTLQYRTVQSRFEEAVRADNDQPAMPFTDAVHRYQAIAGELTPEYIAHLDPLLQPNAWTIRAVSQWRAGEYSPAVQSAGEGLTEIAKQQPTAPQLEQGRDGIILTMLPGLVEDTRLRDRFKAEGAADVAAHYDEYAAKFQTAVRALTEARGKEGPATPGEVIAYWNYQAWRVLENWLFIIGQLPLDDQPAPNRDADAFVKSNFANGSLSSATTLPKAIEAIEAVLPAAYRQLVDLERHR